MKEYNDGKFMMGLRNSLSSLIYTMEKFPISQRWHLGLPKRERCIKHLCLAYLFGGCTF